MSSVDVSLYLDQLYLGFLFLTITPELKLSDAERNVLLSRSWKFFFPESLRTATSTQIIPDPRTQAIKA